MNKRKFEVGDMVVGHTVYRPSVLIVGEIVGIEGDGRPCVHIEDGNLFYINDFVIKTIRHPRKGGKEARAIVAMLLKRARDFRDLANREADKENCDDAYLASCCHFQVAIKNVYGVAKSMLDN